MRVTDLLANATPETSSLFLLDVMANPKSKIAVTVNIFQIFDSLTKAFACVCFDGQFDVVILLTEKKLFSKNQFQSPSPTGCASFAMTAPFAVGETSASKFS